MDKINWAQVVISFFSGGAFGAFVKQYFDNRRNRIQPIGYSLEIKSFYNSDDTNLINAQVTINDGSNEYKFHNLYIGTIEIINTGLADYSEFEFGLTLSEDNRFIQVKSMSGDRHHLAKLSSEPTLINQLSSFDIHLMPFNRKDKYVFDLLLTSSNSNINENSIRISTSKPIRMTRLSSTGDAILAANRSALELLAEVIKKLIHV